MSLVLTWGIGLAPPLLLRFVFFRRPFKMWSAVGTVVVFWMFNLLLFLALGSQSKTHTALLLIAMVSFFILRKGAKEQQLEHDNIKTPTPEKNISATSHENREDGGGKLGQTSPDVIDLRHEQKLPQTAAGIGSETKSISLVDANENSNGKQQARGEEGMTQSTDKLIWSEEFKILYEYAPLVKECHDELDGIDSQLSERFREEVVSDRKKASEICDRLKAEHEKKMKPFASESLNESLAKARLLGPRAEEEFTRIIEVMGEDVDVHVVIQRLNAKYNVLPPPEDVEGKLKYWGIDREGDLFEFGRFSYRSIDIAIEYAKKRLDVFFNNVPFEKLQGILNYYSYNIEELSDGSFQVTPKDGISVTLMADEFPRYIKEKISPNEIKKYLDNTNEYY